MGGEDREVLGIVYVKSPVGYRGDKVHENDIARKDIHNGEEGSDERAAKEWSYDWPVKSQGPDA